MLKLIECGQEQDILVNIGIWLYVFISNIIIYD